MEKAVKDLLTNIIDEDHQCSLSCSDDDSDEEREQMLEDIKNLINQIACIETRLRELEAKNKIDHGVCENLSYISDTRKQTNKRNKRQRK